MSASADLIPGTSIPLCRCCEDEPAALRDDALGLVCTACVADLAVATVALAVAHLYEPLITNSSSSNDR